jgi:hypothetical protein
MTGHAIPACLIAMKPSILLLAALTSALPLRAQQSTFGEGDSYAWGATAGWIELMPQRPLAGDGVRVKDTLLCGYAWSDTTGWIHFGDGAPADGVRYANTAGTDFGVHHDGAGNLSGLAWSATCGWINFGWAAADNPDRPRFDLLTGGFSGYAWGSTLGWINLGSGYLKTDRMAITDADGDGISDAWEIEQAGGTAVLTATGDQDADGVSDPGEFEADTDPLVPEDHLEITDFSLGKSSAQITWTTRPTRLYRIFRGTDLEQWTASLLNDIVPDPGPTTTRTEPHPPGTRLFFRVKAVVPLQP